MTTNSTLYPDPPWPVVEALTALEDAGIDPDSEAFHVTASECPAALAARRADGMPDDEAADHIAGEFQETYAVWPGTDPSLRWAYVRIVRFFAERAAGMTAA